jgi:hypothetical protein
MFDDVPGRLPLIFSCSNITIYSYHFHNTYLIIFDQMVWFIIIPSEFSNTMWYMIKITPLNIPSEFDPWVKQPGTSPSSPHSNCRPLCAWDLPGWCSLRGSSMGKPHFFGFNVIYWLVVEPPLWKIWKSGLLFPTYGNHQPVPFDLKPAKIGILRAWKFDETGRFHQQKWGFNKAAQHQDAARSDHRIPHGTPWDPMGPNGTIGQFIGHQI